MKFNRILLPFVALALFSSSCDDPIPDWEKPQKPPKEENKPLSAAEALAKYKAIKEYAAEYTPNFTVGLGLGASEYLRDAAYKSVANGNFQSFTTGNAMKHSSVVKANGDLDFSTIDAFLAAVPADIDVYGHNFLWHTQQKQAYLKSLIAPEVKEVEVGEDDGKDEGESDGICENTVTNSGFEDGTTSGYASLWAAGNYYDYALESPGHDSDYAIHFTILPACVNMYDAQLFWNLVSPLENGVTYAYEFYAKSDSGLTVQFLAQNDNYDGIYDGWFVPGTDWTYFSGEFTYNASEVTDVKRVGLQFGGTAGSQIWFDDFKFGRKADAPAAASKGTKPAATETVYIYKTQEEKKTILLGAMESWIKQMAEHVGDRVTAWDVINEPIADGSNKWRGIDNTFMQGDSAPVENNGLNLNWGADHWYWAYYIGKEYAVKAFQFARQYCAEGTKLFVNDYNLEISPNKLRALVDFVKYIDEQNGSPIVDGIGTQMHVQASVKKDQVDAMFKTMAATGKLVRITELDVSVGTATPTPEQLRKQAETYRMIVESYKANVPEAQQSGITVWTLSDNPAEHIYWLPNDAPNLFDADYGRKEAYKYFCDGLAGRDLALDFNNQD